MKVITNEELITQRKKWANRLSPVAMVLLLVGLYISFTNVGNEEIDPQTFYLMMGLLLAGFIISSISSSLVNRWVREPRADQVLSKTLKGFDSKHVLFNYTAPAPHIFLTQNKVYAITPKPHSGEITVKQSRFKRKFQLVQLFRFMSDEGLGNPTLEAKQNVKKLTKLLQENLPPETDIPIEPLIVFTNPDVNLQVTDPEIPVISSNQLKNLIRQETKGASINRDVRQQLIKVFGNEHTLVKG